MRSGSLWSLPTVLLGAIAAYSAGQPLSDPDLWWHLRAGDDILAGRFPRVESWSFTTAGSPFVITSWISDVLFSLVHDWLGFRGLQALSVALALAILIGAYRSIRRHARPEPAAWVLLLVATCLLPFLYARAQLFTFLLAVVVASWGRDLLHGAVVRPWRWIALTYLWANLHGGWVVAPVILVTATLAQSADTYRRHAGWRSVRPLVTSLATALLAFLSTALTPVGPQLLTRAVAVNRVGPFIAEWQHTMPATLLGLPYTLLLGTIAISWARGGHRVARSEILYVVMVSAFGFYAVRNVPIAALLLAPIAASCAQELLEPLLPRRPSTVPGFVVAGAVGLGLAVALTLVALRPGVSPNLPWRIASSLEQADGPKRVMVDYDIGGFIVGNARSATVSIDGRADTYPFVYFTRYMTAMKTGTGLPNLVHELNPDYAVIASNTHVAHFLVDHGWRHQLTDQGYDLLRAPESPQGQHVRS